MGCSIGNARYRYKKFIEMKIKTITTWADYNYGASLQAYALTTYLKTQGHDVEMINYLPPYQTRMYDYMWVNPESKASKYMVTRWIYRIAKFAQRMTTLGRKKVFDEFNFKTLPLTPKCYRSFEELKKNPPKADLFIVGSDQVWNVLYDAGKDPSFYLEFVNEGKKASYAASFSFLDIDEDNRRRIAKSLSSFDGVAVREYQGRELLQTMGIESTWVLDPVFLLSVKAWTDFYNYGKCDYIELLQESYLLIYDFEGNQVLKSFATDYAKRNNLKIYAITDKYPLRYADKNFKTAGPIDFVRLIANCKAFISNSFHGTAFSIIFHKPVFVFNRHRHKVNSRMKSLLTAFDLNDCLLDSEEKKCFAMDKQFDWEAVDKSKEEMLEKSVEYLRTLNI